MTRAGSMLDHASPVPWMNETVDAKGPSLGTQYSKGRRRRSYRWAMALASWRETRSGQWSLRIKE